MSRARSNRITVNYLLNEPIDDQFWRGWLDKADDASLQEAFDRTTLDVARGVDRAGLRERLAALRTELEQRAHAKRKPLTRARDASIGFAPAGGVPVTPRSR